jgi:5,10-methylenetetrahydromethanopterin reductase
LRGLLRGEEVEWEGATIGMMQPAGFAPPRPIDVPLLIGAAGPKGLAVARALGDGVFVTRPVPGFAWAAQLATGTVLEQGEAPGTERAMAAAGHAAAVAYHGAYERGGPGGVDALPGGAAWREQIERVPVHRRHLAIHDGHLIAPNAIDRTVLNGEVLARYGGALDAAGWRERLSRWEQEGTSEVAFQPAGPDIPRELTAFARMAGL